MNAITSAVRVEQIGNATLYLGDCRDVMPILGIVDATITDPPYGVNLTGKVYHSTNSGKTVKRHTTYATYQDTAENFDAVVLPALATALSISRCGAVFMAEKTLPKLPPWAALGGIFSPAGPGLGSWGFHCFMHCALYGKDPYLAAGMGSRPTGKYGMYGNDSNKVDHPCAKPIAAMMWAVERASLIGHVVFDPFMGSGTTGVACARLGRSFVGVEIDPGYFDVACQRITDAQRQGDLLTAAPKEDPYFMRTADLFPKE